MKRLFLIHSLAIVSTLGGFCSFAIAADLKQFSNLSLFQQTILVDDSIAALAPPDRPQPPRKPRGDEGSTRKLKMISDVIPLQIAQADQTREVLVTVISARALSKFDPSIPLTSKHKADFLARVRIGNAPINSTRKFNDNDNPTFNETFQGFAPVSVERIPIHLNLIDSDGDVLPGIDLSNLRPDDDVADISPNVDRILRLQYIPSTGRILDSTGNQVGRRGQIVTIKGDSGKNDASITFSIDHRNRSVAQ